MKRKVTSIHISLRTKRFGRMEEWKNGIKKFKATPLFHHSTIPLTSNKQLTNILIIKQY